MAAADDEDAVVDHAWGGPYRPPTAGVEGPLDRPVLGRRGSHGPVVGTDEEALASLGDPFL